MFIKPFIRRLMGVSIIVAVFIIARYATERLNLNFPPALYGIATMFLLFVGLKYMPRSIESAAWPLLKNMPLFFVPAIVGMLAFKDMLLNHAIAIFCAIFISTILSLILTVWLSQKCLGSLDVNPSDADDFAGKHD